MSKEMCNCRVSNGDPRGHEANCAIVLAFRQGTLQKRLDQLKTLIPFPGLEAFHEATKDELQDQIDRLERRLTHKDQPKRGKR
jgi:hypothetical protein